MAFKEFIAQNYYVQKSHIIIILESQDAETILVVSMKKRIYRLGCGYIFMVCPIWSIFFKQ